MPDDGAPPPWYAAGPDDVARRLATGATGLSEGEAAARLARHGPNRMPAARPPGPLRRLAGQFGDVLIHVLLAAAAIARGWRCPALR